MQLGEIAVAEKVRGHRAIPEQGAGVVARGRSDAIEQLAAGFPVWRPASPAAPASVLDQWKAADISRYGHADVGMKDSAAVQQFVGSHRASAVEITLQFVECESAIVNKED